MRKAHVGFAAAVTAGFVAMAAGQTAFTPGNLVVLRLGDGSAQLSSAATAVFLEEITPMGMVVQTIAMPAAATTVGNRAATTSGTATSEGFMARSVDGRYLMYMGYNADAGTPSIAGTTSAAVNRVVARIAADGTVDTSTAFSDGTYSGSNPRSVISIDGSQFWMGGNGSPASNAGVRYATFGATESVQISDAPTNTRVVGIFDGQLFVTTQSGAFRGVSTVGTGLPTTGGNVTTLLDGFDPATNSPQNNYGFYFADADTLYLADERSIASGGGIQKWTQDGTTWTLQYTLNTGLSAGVRGLTGTTTRAGTTLYVTTADGINASNGNRLMMVQDTGPGAEFILIALAGGHTAYRSVAFTPEDPGTSCYANCDGSTIEPVLNVDDFTCFINEFAAAQSLSHPAQIEHYANCDASTIAPVLNVDDFTCFINAYAQGCP